MGGEIHSLLCSLWMFVGQAVRHHLFMTHLVLKASFGVPRLLESLLHLLFLSSKTRNHSLLVPRLPGKEEHHLLLWAEPSRQWLWLVLPCSPSAQSVPSEPGGADSPFPWLSCSSSSWASWENLSKPGSSFLTSPLTATSHAGSENKQGVG